MATVQQAIAGLAEIVRAVDGVRGALDAPPDNLAGDYIAVCLMDAGVWEVGPAGMMRGLHDLKCIITVARRNLASDAKAVMPFVDSIPTAIFASPTLGGTVETFGSIRVDVGPIRWGENEEAARFGVTLTLVGCKIRTEI